jgi:hypothetical protein
LTCLFQEYQQNEILFFGRPFLKISLLTFSLSGKFISSVQSLNNLPINGESCIYCPFITWYINGLLQPANWRSPKKTLLQDLPWSLQLKSVWLM